MFSSLWLTLQKLKKIVHFEWRMPQADPKGFCTWIAACGAGNKVETPQHFRAWYTSNAAG
jgi:hypothetical protein